MKLLPLLALALLLPVVQAQTNEGGLETYVIDVHSFTRDNPAAGVYFDRELTLAIPHGFAVQSSTALLHIAYSTQTGSTANGVWQFTAYWDNVALCAWSVETTSTLTNTIGFPFSGIWCALTDAQVSEGAHDFRVERTTASGTPAALSHETYSSYIERTDLLEPLMPTQFEALTGLTGTEFFAILALALLCLGVAAFSRQPIAQIAASLLLILLGVLLLFFNTSPIIVILAGLLLVLGALTFLQVGLQLTQRGKPERRRFFE